MPEFEENEDAAKNAPYTYEPSRSSAAELGELAGVVITPVRQRKRQPSHDGESLQIKNLQVELPMMFLPVRLISLMYLILLTI